MMKCKSKKQFEFKRKFELIGAHRKIDRLYTNVGKLEKNLPNVIYV